MTAEDKLASLMNDRLDFGESPLECRVYSKSKGIKLVVLGTEHQENPIKFTTNVKILKHIDVEVGNRVLVAFIQGKINKPIIVGVIK
ncbi:hypothetical protein MBCUT_06920 [Methanobrevibacter cuticularis]|uniref:tRNA-binding domain-containing protein n=1 Tax=Methanobrevibacter cuticularis TaxID=47311 RepID=A0A166EHC6_9EURY|nr:hypothetical protein [Methanobrevibacter cuticularis]KZX16654.1 hypothetical protein MBCUT_06920 [Methanobrevibacter cuticularis]